MIMHTVWILRQDLNVNVKHPVLATLIKAVSVVELKGILVSMKSVVKELNAN